MSESEKERPGGKRQFVGVTFSCCKVYSRVYLNPNRKRQFGWCPKCGGRIEITLSPTGSNRRFFSAG